MLLLAGGTQDSLSLAILVLQAFPDLSIEIVTVISSPLHCITAKTAPWAVGNVWLIIALISFENGRGTGEDIC